MKRRDLIKNMGIVGILGTLGFSDKLFGGDVQKTNEITPPTEEEGFYQFFLNFNGFPINETQKKLYKEYWLGGKKYATTTRQVGTSTLLLTIAVYESEQGKRVFMAYPANSLAIENRNKYWDYAGKYNYGIHFYNTNTIGALRGKSYDVGLFDVNFQIHKKQHLNQWWQDAIPSTCWGGKHLAISQIDII